MLLPYVAVGIVVAINLGALYFLALKGIQRGLQWQLSFLSACLVEWSVDTFVMETVEVLWIEYFVLHLIVGDVQRAVLVLVSCVATGFDRWLTTDDDEELQTVAGAMVYAPDRSLWYALLEATEDGRRVVSRGWTQQQRWWWWWLGWLASLSVEGHHLCTRLVTTCVVGVIVFGWYALHEQDSWWFVLLRVMYLFVVSVTIGLATVWAVYRQEMSRVSFQQQLLSVTMVGKGGGGAHREDVCGRRVEVVVEEAHPANAMPSPPPPPPPRECTPITNSVDEEVHPSIGAPRTIFKIDTDDKVGSRDPGDDVVDDSLSFQSFAPSELSSRGSSRSSPRWPSISPVSSPLSESLARSLRMRSLSDSIDGGDESDSDDDHSSSTCNSNSSSSWSSLSL